MTPFFALQVDLAPALSPESVLPNAGDILSNPIVVLFAFLLGLALFVILVLNAIRAMFLRRGKANTAFGHKVLRVRVPKELTKQDVGKDQVLQQIQEAAEGAELVVAAASQKPSIPSRD